VYKMRRAICTVDAESNLNCTYAGNNVVVDAESNLNCAYTDGHVAVEDENILKRQ